MRQAAALAAFFFLSLPGSRLAADDDAPGVEQPALASELLRRVEVDQAARRALVEFTTRRGANGGAVDLSQLSEAEQATYDALAAKLKAVDAENTAWLKQTVELHGWPTITAVGEAGGNAAWLLVQHADADVKFQRKCLDLMTRLPPTEASPSNLAYLTDRVRLAEGQPQIYGTQFIFENGRLTPRPIENEANVDRRRAELGLPPLTVYKRRLEKLYGVKGE